MHSGMNNPIDGTAGGKASGIVTKRECKSRPFEDAKGGQTTV
jgi:hypothetical protein